MKKIQLLFCLLFVVTAKAQTPYSSTLNLTGSVNSGTFVNNPSDFNARHVTSNQQISGSAYVIYYANQEIKLTHGFAVSGNPLFEAKIRNSGDIEVVDMTKGSNPWNPKKYERFELGVSLPDNIQNQVNAFLSTGNNGAGKLNPYDPEQLKIKAEFTQGSNTYVRYGFYYKDYQQQSDSDWTYISSPYTYRLRFAPPATGVWTVTVRLLVNNVQPCQFRGTFTVQSGTDNNGFLTIDNYRRRFKFTESGNVFFGIGQNIAGADWVTFNKGPSWANGWCGNCVADPHSYNEQRSFMDSLASKGGNFVRIRLDPWSNPVESHDVHQFPNSDNPNLTLTPSLCINNYDHNQRHMWEFDSTLALCENRGLYIMLNLLQEQYMGIKGDNDPNHEAPVWHNNPYGALLGDTTETGVKAFFTDTLAIKFYKKFLFYVQARWGYSTHIALWGHVNETCNLGTVDGVRTGTNTLYQSDLPFRANVDAWICSMKTYMETGDNGQGFYPWHPHTTGVPSTHDLKDGPQCLNVWSRNNYNYEEFVNYNYRYRDVVVDHLNKGQPFLHGEIGASERAECNRMMDKHGDNEFHNAIWAGTFSGALTTPLYWNDWHSDYIDHRENFRTLKAFTDLIDFNEFLIPYRSWVSISGKSSYDFKLQNTQASVVYGWAQNASHNWRSEAAVIDSLNSYYYQTLINNETPCFQHTLSVTCNNIGTFPIYFYNMQHDSWYRIDFYSPYTGAFLYSAWDSTSALSSPLIFTYNFDCGSNADVAYIVRKVSGYGARSMSVDSTAIGDSVYVHQNTNTATAKAHPHPVAKTLPKPATVMVKNNITVYPNPAQDIVRIVNESGEAIDKCSLYDLLGKEQAVEVSHNKQSINISQLAAGVYLLHIYCKGNETVFRIIKTY